MACKMAPLSRKKGYCPNIPLEPRIDQRAITRGERRLRRGTSLVREKRGGGRKVKDRAGFRCGVAIGLHFQHWKEGGRDSAWNGETNLRLSIPRYLSVVREGEIVWETKRVDRSKGSPSLHSTCSLTSQREYGKRGECVTHFRSPTHSTILSWIVCMISNLKEGRINTLKLKLKKLSNYYCLLYIFRTGRQDHWRDRKNSN